MSQVTEILSEKPPNDRDIWEGLVKETEDIRRGVEEYKRSKTPVLDPPPRIFPLV